MAENWNRWRRSRLPVATTAAAVVAMSAVVVAAAMHTGVVALQVFVGVIEVSVLAGLIHGARREAAERRAARDHHPSGPSWFMSELPRQRVRTALRDAMSEDGSAAVLLFDLDGFKLVNEGFGHDVGDHVISIVRARLESRLGGGGRVVPLGGDEYAVVLRGPIGIIAASDRAAELSEAVSDPIVIVGIELAVTASVGVALATGDATPAAVVDHASMAVHRAKRLGGRRVVLYDDALQTEARDKLALSAALRHAVNRHELVVEYHTVNDLVTSRPTAVEALVRWNHPVLGRLQPERFIPLAEDIGMINAIGRWVLGQACRDLHQLDRANPSVRLGLWVNVSPLQLATPNFVGEVCGILADHRVDPKRVTLEITENSVIDDLDRVTAVLCDLKAHGIRLAIDDFGVGFSALAYLDQLPVDVVKLDRRFVSRLGFGSDGTVVSAVVGLGTGKGLDVVAEGVETIEQLAILRSTGCRSAQGFLFGRPVGVERLVRQLTARSPAVG